MASGNHFAPINVDGVAHRLKSIEADSSRQQNSQRHGMHLPPQGRCKALKIICEKIEILEKSKYPEIASNIQN
jgi:hypothetical protein